MQFDIFNSVKSSQGQPCTLEAYLQLVGDTRIAALAQQIAACEDKEQRQALKKQLPVITWQAAFGGKPRKNGNAQPSGLFPNDYDHVEDVQGLMEAALKRREELGIVYIGRSISGTGVHIVAECRPEFDSIAECQQWLSDRLGQPNDPACKDWARGFYAVPSSYEFYIDQSLFEREPRIVYDPLGTVSSPSAGSSPAAVSSPSAVSGFLVSRGADAGENSPQETRNKKPETQSSFKGIPLMEIAEEWLKQNGGIPQEGERNNQLHKLASRLRYITEFNPVVIARNIPHYGLSDEEVMGLCKSACQAQRALDMPWDLKTVLCSLVHNEESLEEDEKQETQKPETAGAAAPLPQAPPLPPVFKQFHDAAPEDFKAASVLCLLPLLGTLGSRLRAKYLNGKNETPSFNVTLEAPQASGKSFIEKMTARCFRELKKKDDEGHALERQYQEADKMAKLGTTKNERKERQQELDSRKIPIIRKMPATASITKLLIRMENAQGLHLFALAVEIDTVYKAFKRGFSNLSDLLRCAFDNSEYGQDYATDTSYSGNLPIYYNTLYSGTPKAIRRFYPDSEDGTLSRTLFVTLPDQFGKPMPVWRDMTASEEALLDVGLTKLYEVSLVGDEVQPEHMMEMPFLNKRLEEWMEQQRQLTLETQDRTRNTFYRRCAELAFRAGMVAWYLYDEKQSPKVKKDVCKFAIWVAERMLQQFLMRVEPEDEHEKAGFFAKAVYNSLPAQFTREQLELKLREFGYRSNTYDVLIRWKRAGCVATDTPWGASVLNKVNLKS